MTILASTSLLGSCWSALSTEAPKREDVYSVQGYVFLFGAASRVRCVSGSATPKRGNPAYLFGAAFRMHHVSDHERPAERRTSVSHGANAIRNMPHPKVGVSAGGGRPLAGGGIPAAPRSATTLASVITDDGRGRLHSWG